MRIGGTGGTTGTGTANKVTKWASGTALGDSSITDNGTTVTFAGAIAETGSINVGVITGTLNDWTPTGFVGARTVYLDSNNATLNGIAGGVDGRIVALVNVRTSSSMTVSHESAGSVAANRIVSHNGTSPTIGGSGGNSSVVLRYDGAVSRWRIVSLFSESLFCSNFTASTAFLTSTTSGPQLSGAASSTVPTLIPNRASSTTGIGAQAAGNISLIAAGVETVRLTATETTIYTPVALPNIATPATPAAGITVVYSADIAGHPTLSTIDSTGIPMPLQASWAFSRAGTWAPNDGALTFATAGPLPLPTVSPGTITARTTATTGFVVSLRRIAAVSAASAASAAVIRGVSARPRLWRGDAAGRGGFLTVIRFNVSDAVLVGTANMFVGLIGASIVADGLPSTYVNAIGIGCDSGDTTMQLYASGSSAQARIDLGANFPVNTTDADAYELTLYAPPNGADIRYRVVRLNTASVASGTISVSANLPASTTTMGPHLFRGNGATAAAVGIDMHGVYVETAY